MKRLIKASQQLKWQSISYEYKDEGFFGQDMPEKNITCWQEGLMYTSSLNGLNGVNGENREWREYNGEKYFGNYTEQEWNNFLEDIKQNGIQEKIVIDIKKNGNISIYEGNHRLKAAEQLGFETVPVELRYYGNRQQIEKFEL